MKKILVVEDNETNMYLIHYILTRAGFQVCKASNGEEGVAAAESELPDLVLMDIQLPGIDGLEATRRIRSSQKLASVPIVALTAHAMTGDREKVMGAGCDGYIEKPINPETLLDTLKKHLEV